MPPVSDSYELLAALSAKPWPQGGATYYRPVTLYNQIGALTGYFRTNIVHTAAEYSEKCEYRRFPVVGTFAALFSHRASANGDH
jgi:hypothetical protein